jgi:hypothetical protein
MRYRFALGGVLVAAAGDGYVHTVIGGSEGSRGDGRLRAMSGVFSGWLPPLRMREAEVRVFCFCFVIIGC